MNLKIIQSIKQRCVPAFSGCMYNTHYSTRSWSGFGNTDTLLYFALTSFNIKVAISQSQSGIWNEKFLTANTDSFFSSLTVFICLWSHIHCQGYMKYVKFYILWIILCICEFSGPISFRNEALNLKTIVKFGSTKSCLIFNFLIRILKKMLLFSTIWNV